MIPNETAVARPDSVFVFLVKVIVPHAINVPNNKAKVSLLFSTIASYTEVDVVG